MADEKLGPLSLKDTYYPYTMTDEIKFPPNF